MGLQADMIAQNRKLLEDIQYRVRKADCERSDAPDLLRDTDSKGAAAGRAEDEQREKALV